MSTKDFEAGFKGVILDATEPLTKNRNQSPAAWTDAIFTALTKYAYDGFPALWVWSKRNEIDRTLTGFLYDFMLCEGGGNAGNDIGKVWVALESEWSAYFEEIKADFYKLVLSRSMLRVMIFKSSDVEKAISELVRILETSPMSISGDRYLFAGRGDDYSLIFKSHTKA
jgi:hypothetical protein